LSIRHSNITPGLFSRKIAKNRVRIHSTEPLQGVLLILNTSYTILVLGLHNQGLITLPVLLQQ
jgi:hypothetical protein